MKRITAFIFAFGMVLNFIMPASADFAYTTENGTLGIFTVTSLSSTSIDVTMSDTYEGYSEDLFVSGFYNTSNPGLIVIEKNQGSSVSGDYAYIYNGTDFVTPVYEGYLAGVRGANAVASANNGRSIFIASENNASIAEFDLTSLSDMPRHYYTYPYESFDIQALVLNGYYLYALFTNPESEDQKSKIKQFDGQLLEKTSYLSADVDHYANDIVIASNAGVFIGTDSGFELFRYNKSTSIVSDDSFGSVKSMCSDESNGFYFVSSMLSGDQIFRYKNSGEVVWLHSTPDNGAYQKILYDNDKKILAAVMGGRVVFLNVNNDTPSLIASYTSSSFDGAVTGIAKIFTSGASDQRSSSGCDFMSLGFLTGALIIALSLKKR